MKVKLTLMRAGGHAIDLAVTAESTTTMGKLAHALHVADPERNQAASLDQLTLRLHPAAGEASRLLDAGATIDDTSLASGSVLSLAPIGSVSAGEGGAAATMRVISGPDAGTSFPLAAGSSTVGRDGSSRVVLSDPLVSKLHVRVNVTDHVEIIDAGSSNGTTVNGQLVERVILLDGDIVTIGDSVFTISATAHSGAATAGGVVQYNRSPRLDPQYQGVTIKAPELPERPKPQRLPLLALFAPLVLGGVFLFVNPGNPASVLFIAMTPILLLGTFLDGMLQTRKAWKQLRKDFAAEVDSLDKSIEVLHDDERAVRQTEAPSTAEVVTESSQLRPLLWTRRPEHSAFLQVRLGIGRMRSRSVLENPEQRKGVPEMWDQIVALQRKMVFVDRTPATENLRASGSLGVAGAPDLARGVARGLIAQLAGLHSPAELALVGIASTASSPAWDWLKWLPHVGSPFLPLGAPPLGTGGPAANALIAEVEELVSIRRDNEGSEAVTLPALVIVVEDDAPVERARLVGIAESGPAVGIHLIWIAPAIARVPAACRTFVELGAGTDQSLGGYVHDGYGVAPIACESLTEEQATQFARALSPVVDSGAKIDDASDLPRSVSLLNILGTQLSAESSAIIDRWRETTSILTGDYASPPSSKSRPNLRAVFGQAASEPFALDLRADGPHALVGGTTGSGKSEFLQAWILGLATTHSPQRVSFLFVDYKGGAAFAECLRLPHTVGLVTDLSPHLVRRALTSLRAELRYREHLFNRKKVKDIVEFERTGDPDVPPSLVIVVDEFAALATEVPEFVDGVVDVAQRGRSLGLHLILATQRPAGVIRDNLRANTNLRVALRMADEADSSDVLGTPMAASFDPAVPGRGAAKTGPGRVRPFQSGYAGGWTGEAAPPTDIVIEQLQFGVPVEWPIPIDVEEESRRAAASDGPTDISRIVATVREAARVAGIPAPRKPWLPELADAYDFSKLPNRRTDSEVLLGVVDDAASQTQPTVSYFPDRDGNMAIIGTGGSGKSTTLRTIAVASAVTMRGGPVEVYGLDFAAGGLQMLEGLPHVGSIVPGDDEERVARLLRWLRDLVDDRAVRFSEARAGNIVDYRVLAGRPDEPRLLLLLDGMGAFREAYEASFSSPWFAVFSQIATDGRQVGVHVIVTGDRAGAIPASLSSSIQRRLVLRMANADDYSVLGVPGDVLGSGSPPGRGILDGFETQVAVLGGDPNVAVQAREIDKLSAAMAKAKSRQAPSIQRLSDAVAFDSLPIVVEGKPAIGIADDDLRPVGIDGTGSFLISGPPGSGRTTALATVAESIRRSQPSTRLIMLSPRRASLAIPGAVTGEGALVGTIVTELLSELESGAIVPGSVAVFIESLTDFVESEIEGDLEALLKALIKADQFVAAESETSTWASAYSFGRLMKAGRRGVILQPDDGDEDLLKASFGRIARGTYPPGRGFLVAGGRSRKIQMAALDALSLVQK